MAKPLVFQFGDRDIAFSMNKVDRSKLYGFKEMEVLADNGEVCDLATLADDGKTVVGRGGTGIGYLSADGEWCDKSELIPVDLEGKEITPIASSFNAPIKLFQTATCEELLNHNIRIVYQLQAEDAVIDDLQEELQRGTIFAFPYSYRGGLEADAGFLLRGDDGNIFFLVGNPTNIEMIGLQQSPEIADENAADDDETDLMDFGMI